MTANDATTITITLLESQRALAIVTSGVAGGDNGGYATRVMANSIQDIAGNKLAGDVSLVFNNESPDSIMPGVESATVELTTGVVTIIANETVDVTPPENVNLTAISFVGSGKSLPMTGSTIDENDDVFSPSKMPESARVASILNSNTPGGDGSTQTLTLLAGSIRDIATNLLPIDNTFISLTEIIDFGNPVVTKVELNYSMGRFKNHLQRND